MKLGSIAAYALRGGRSHYATEKKAISASALKAATKSKAETVNKPAKVSRKKA
jgi:hypothetical protein